jgi:hypothetical protein
LTLLALASVLPAVTYGQGHAREAELAERHLEREMDRPAPRRPFETTSRGAVVPEATFTSVQVNVNAAGQNIVGDAANEPSLTVDPTNPNRIAIGWRQFDNISSNFRQAGRAYSTNAGATWTFPGSLTPGTFRSDPVLASTPGGIMHYNSLINSFFTDEFRSLDGGVNWSLLGAATGGDKQWITIDNTNSSGSGFIYQCWSTAGNNYGGRQFSRSTDGGFTWLNPINIPNQPVWGTLDVDSNGTLYLCGSDGGSAFFYARSSNARIAAQTPTWDRSGGVNMGGSQVFGAVVNPGGLGGQSWIACDRSGGAFNNAVYMLASVNRGASNPADVMFVRSLDGGTTWSTPRRVNDDPAGQGRYHWFGTMSVAPNGRIDACWYDTRNSGGNNLNSELWYSYSLDGGATWAANIRISPAFNTTIGYPNQNKIGDYIGMVSDNVGAGVAYCATFTGGQDVYYVRIVAVPQDVLADSLAFFRGQQAGGNLASLSIDDDNYLVGRPGLTLNGGEAPLQIDLEATSPVSGPTGLSFKIVAKGSAPALSQEVQLYDWVAQEFVSVDTRATTTVDQTVQLNAPGDVTRFVAAGSRNMRTRLVYRQTGPVASFPWSASIDQAQWRVTP